MPLPKAFGIARGWPVAAGTYVPPPTPIVIGPTPPPVQTVWRGMGTGIMAPAVTGGGTILANGFRKAVYLRKTVSRMKVLLPTFYITSADVDVTQPLDFQVGIDEAFTQSMTVPARRPVTFGGLNTAHYDPGSGPFGFIESDIYTFTTPKQGWISVFTSIEWSGTVVNNGQPRNAYLQSVAGHYEKTFSSASSLAATNWALNTTALGSESVGAAGSFIYCPYLLVEFTDGTRSVLTLGTSSGFGTGETSGSVTTDNFGDAFGNRGWPQRFLDRTLGMAYSNMAKPSDDMASFVATNAARRRLALIAKLNPTDVWFQYGRNDIGSSTLQGMRDNANAIMNAIRAVLPSIGNKFYPTTVMPYTTSTANWTAADGSDQSVANGNYGPGSLAQQYDDVVRSLVYPFVGCPGYFDATTAVMLAATANDYKWKANGTAKYYTGDGLHGSERASEELVLPYYAAHNPIGSA